MDSLFKFLTNEAKQMNYRIIDNTPFWEIEVESPFRRACNIPKEFLDRLDYLLRNAPETKGRKLWPKYAYAVMGGKLILSIEDMETGNPELDDCGDWAF